MGRYEQTTSCDNLNHRRTNAPVAHCPQCGVVVNASRPARPCGEAVHAAARRDRAAFCADCGEQLIFER